MLNGIQLKNLKSFADTTHIPLKKINILLGANNAGKTTFLSAIELFLRSLRGYGVGGPLEFESMSSYASFDSSLRRHWSRSDPRPQSIDLKYDYTSDDDGDGKPGRPVHYEFSCKGHSKDDTIVVKSAVYTMGKESASVSFEHEVDGNVNQSIKVGDKTYEESERWFVQLLPFGLLRNSKTFGALLRDNSRGRQLEVVNPYRPVPRSFYVLDDPNLGREDRSMLTFLLRVWGSNDADDLEIRERLTSSLSALGLAKKFEVAQVSKRIGPKVVEIRVAPTTSRQNVTIADAGFGLSQVLPLVAYDARLKDGYFVAYQPEVHLHPYAQSRLADLFVESSNRGNQIFVETHSPDLILRLQAKIATQEISFKDVNILCFENKSGKSLVTPVLFDEKGKPNMSWPAGFLDTSLNLARELTAARLAEQTRGSKNAK